MVNFLRTRDLDFFGGEGDGDEESDTLTLRLELKWPHQPVISEKSHWSTGPISLSISSSSLSPRDPQSPFWDIDLFY